MNATPETREALAKRGIARHAARSSALRGVAKLNASADPVSLLSHKTRTGTGAQARLPSNAFLARLVLFRLASLQLGVWLLVPLWAIQPWLAKRSLTSPFGSLYVVLSRACSQLGLPNTS